MLSQPEELYLSPFPPLRSRRAAWTFRRANRLRYRFARHAVSAFFSSQTAKDLVVFHVSASVLMPPTTPRKPVQVFTPKVAGLAHRPTCQARTRAAIACCQRS